jgi:hypothetical protein
MNSKKTEKVKTNYRIQLQDGRLLNAGTGKESWFSLEDARSLVNREDGQKIVESNGIYILWEVL